MASAGQLRQAKEHTCRQFVLTVAVRRFLDPICLLLYLLDDRMEFPPQSNVENCAGDGLFRPQLNGFVLIGIWVWGRRWADHVPSTVASLHALPDSRCYLSTVPGRSNRVIPFRMPLWVPGVDKIADVRDSACSRDTFPGSEPMHARARTEFVQAHHPVVAELRAGQSQIVARNVL